VRARAKGPDGVLVAWDTPPVGTADVLLSEGKAELSLAGDAISQRIAGLARPATARASPAGRRGPASACPEGERRALDVATVPRLPLRAGACAARGRADLVLTYDPLNGSQPVDTLPPGRGAWVYAAADGTITVTPLPP
jgi:hypothetical protein